MTNAFHEFNIHYIHIFDIFTLKCFNNNTIADKIVLVNMVKNQPGNAIWLMYSVSKQFGRLRDMFAGEYITTNLCTINLCTSLGNLWLIFIFILFLIFHSFLKLYPLLSFDGAGVLFTGIN